MTTLSTRHIASKFLTDKSTSFQQEQSVMFSIWNLRKDGSGKKNWFRVGMGASTGLAMETYTTVNGTSIVPILEHPRPIIKVAVNEYPPFVYKRKPIGEESCVGGLVPCYETLRVNSSTALAERKFCCCGASLDFLAFLQRDLNFEAHIYFNPDGQYGVFDERISQWNGIVQELVEGRATLSLEMGLNRRRAEVISFAHPTLQLELGILIKKSDMLKGKNNPIPSSTVRKKYRLYRLQHSQFVLYIICTRHVVYEPFTNLHCPLHLLRKCLDRWTDNFLKSEAIMGNLLTLKPPTTDGCHKSICTNVLLNLFDKRYCFSFSGILQRECRIVFSLTHLSCLPTGVATSL